MIKCKSRCANNRYTCCKDCEHYKGTTTCEIDSIVCFKAMQLNKDSIPIICERAIWINEEEKENE